MEINKVAGGPFIDMCAYNGRVFALERFNSSVHVLAQLLDSDDWIAEKTIKLMKLPDIYLGGMQTLTVDTHIYVTSHSSKDVYVYNHSGEILRKYDISTLMPVSDPYIRLCGVDTQGTVLLAVNNRLYQWNKHTGCREIRLSECERHIMDVVTDMQRGNIWAVENSKVLLKYTKRGFIAD